jgi:hypothetical protein
MKHWYVFIIYQSCGREFFAERHCRKKDVEVECNRLARHYNADVIRYFRRGKNHFKHY